MQIRQVHIRKDLEMGALDPLLAIKPQVVLAFGNGKYFADYKLGARLREKFPDAIIVGCSSAGEIVDNAVYDGSLVITALASATGKWRVISTPLEDISQSRTTGEKLGREMASFGPQSVFVIAPGLNINGGEMVDGIVSELGANVTITGGLAGDGLNFAKTYTMVNEAVSNNQVIALGLVDPGMQVTYGTQGGWNPFGPYRRVTRAKDNILYELDNKPALELYKNYLGDKAKDLPGAGLLYPLNVISNDKDENSVVRSILAVDEATNSIMLAGNVSEGYLVRLMHAKTDALVDGARHASVDTAYGLAQGSDANQSLGILVSCIGRKAVMGDDVNDEAAAVKDTFGPSSVITGFYSYGEICPFSLSNKRSTLHNQTMTITRLTPKGA